MPGPSGIQVPQHVIYGGDGDRVDVNVQADNVTDEILNQDGGLNAIFDEHEIAPEVLARQREKLNGEDFRIEIKKTTARGLRMSQVTATVDVDPTTVHDLFLPIMEEAMERLFEAIGRDEGLFSAMLKCHTLDVDEQQ
ncbi:unnamed protein product, partial [Mesorhabditis spiculigera]